MKQFLKVFKTHAEYEAFVNSSEFIKPNTSYCIEDKKTYFHPLDVNDTYLTFVTKEDAKFTFKSLVGNTVYYSLNNGITWEILKSGESTTLVSADNRVLWKGNCDTVGGIGTFSSTGNFEVEGNVMSLLYDKNYNKVNTLEGKKNAFRELFLDNTKLLSAEKLNLPATILSESCYNSMFSGCTNLIKSPKLPSSELKEQCYYMMFRGCTSLKESPILIAKELVDRCYGYMFYGCKNLSKIKAYFNTTPSVLYTSDWVNGVSKTGVFTKGKDSSWDVQGKNAVPTGWTIEK